MTSQTVTTVLLHIAVVAQTGFVILWATLPWYKEWVGRALMVKSAALMLFLDYALIAHYAAPGAWRHVLSAALFGLVTVGIISQVIALPYEMYRAALDRRKVTGTHHDTPADADAGDCPALR